MDFLKSAVASAISKGPLGAYNVAERVELENSIWTLNNATKRDGGARCSIFTFDVLANRNRIPIAKNAFRRFRTLRHPGVPQVLDAIETESQICIITERVTPLAMHKAAQELQQETLRWGLHTIAKTIKFINDEASLVHSMIRMSSVFVSDSGEWKIGSFELLSSTKDEHDNVIYSYSSLVSGHLMPPEVARSSWDMYRGNSWAAVDAYGLGVLMSEAFNDQPVRVGQTPDVGSIPANMTQMFKRLVNPNPKLRPSVGIFLEQGRKSGGYFQTPLITFSENIDSLGLMSEGERDVFLSELQGIKDDFPSDYAKRKILPELLKSAEFGGGGPKVLAVVLQIGSKLSDEEYDAQLTPVLVRLFSSPDRALRVYLLDSLSIMIDHLPQKVVNDKIFPNLVSLEICKLRVYNVLTNSRVTGFTDVAPLVREQTVKSVLVLIPKLSERTVNGNLLKYLAITANDGEPGIRTNTTVCLGKIAKYLGQSTRSKVLVAAFTRALRDPFVHARHAALMAIAATADTFSEDDCASKLLPSLCPSLVDKEKLVRDQANKTLDIYVARIRKYGETLPVTVQPTAQAPSSTGGLVQAATGGAADPGWTGWAISSFASKFAAANGDIEPSANVPLSSGGTPEPSRPTTATSGTASPAPFNSMNKPATVRQTTETTRIAQSFAAAPAEDDGGWDHGFNEGEGGDDAWGTMDDEDDTFLDASAKAVSTTNTIKPTTTSTQNGEPDFASWLAAKQASTTVKKAPLPKGMGTAAKPMTRALPSSKPPSTNLPARTIPAASRVAAKPSVARTPAAPAKKAVEEDEAWGDAWD